MVAAAFIQVRQNTIMSFKKIAVVLLAFGISWAACAAFAEDDAAPRGKTFIQRLDTLGKTIFGGVLPAEKQKAEEPADSSQTKEMQEFAAKAKAKSAFDNRVSKTSPQAKVERPSARSKPMLPDQFDESSAAPQAVGKRPTSIFAPAETAGSYRTTVAHPRDDSDFTPENTPITDSLTSEGTPKPVRRPATDTALFDDADEAATTPLMVQGTPQVMDETASESAPSGYQAPRAAKPSQPIHQRLSSFRKSVFASDNGHEPISEPVAAKPVEPEAADVAAPAPRVMVAQRTKPDLAVEPSAAEGSEPELPAAQPEPMPKAVENTQSPGEAAPADDRMLMTRKGPVLGVETLGPRHILVGKESIYEINMVNSGDVAAEEMVVFLSLPEWAEVVGADVSNGTAEEAVTHPTPGTLQWKLGHLDAKGRERLTLKIIPRQSRAFDLAVRWEYKPVASQAAIEVQEPKLVLQLEGPREVVYGKKEAYRLKLSNVGNGDAENVSLMLMPIGGGENVPATHKIGVLAAGEERALDVELTARQAGNLTIQVDAKAEGGAHAELAEKVVVRRAGLKIDVEGPKVQYVGAAAAYTVRIRNPGNAPAQNVNMAFVLPAGAKYLSGVENAQLDPGGSKLQWTLESIGPDVEQSFVVKCRLGAAGVGHVQVSASADDDLTASANTVTRIDAVANLTMDVKDPGGPAAIGQEVAYEIRVRNRGTKAATDVEVIAYFSRGIEPTSAEGGQSRLGPGQVTFRPIPMLAPGAEMVFKVRARAEDTGNHIFRAEAHCRSLGTRLVSEATNLYYSDSEVQTAQGSRFEGPASDAMRTGSRSAMQGQLAPVTPRK